MACFIEVWDFFYRAWMGGEAAEGGERVAALWFKDSQPEGVGYHEGEAERHCLNGEIEEESSNDAWDMRRRASAVAEPVASQRRRLLLVFLSHRIICKCTDANCSLHPGVF
jgi:hypothetical protein